MTTNLVALELQHEYPLLWEIAQQYDFAERLGGCTEPRWAEVDGVLRELWMARNGAGRVVVDPASRQDG